MDKNKGTQIYHSFTKRQKREAGEGLAVYSGYNVSHELNCFLGVPQH